MMHLCPHIPPIQSIEGGRNILLEGKTRLAHSLPSLPLNLAHGGVLVNPGLVFSFLLIPLK